jgi:tetratricopeptide (TPR) repeat protein
MRSIACLLFAAFLFTPVGACLADAGDPASIESVITRFRSVRSLPPGELAGIETTVGAALAVRPEDERVRYAKVLLDRAKGDRKAAKQAVEALVKQSPAVAEYRSTHGTLCFEVIGDAGMFEKMNIATTGRAEYEKAIALDSSLVEPRIGLARFYLMAPGYAGGSYRKAEEQATLLLALPEGKGEFFGRSLLADIYADKGEWTKVEEQFVLAETSNSPGANPQAAMRGYAQILLKKKKDPAAALVILERYQAKAAPDDANVWFLTGEAKKAIGDDQGAIAAYTKAIDIQADAMVSRITLAELLEKNKRYAEAAVHYTEFASRFPADSRAASATASAARCQKRSK